VRPTLWAIDANLPITQIATMRERMGNTVAVNSVGLDAEGAHSSPRDMVSIATTLMQDPTFRTTVARTDARMNGQNFAATNKLLTSYEGATGVKTGHTTDAGYCLVGSATRGDRSVIVAVLGAFVGVTGKWRNPFVLPSRSLTFLVLSAFATGASWVCYFRALKVGEAAKVAPVDKLSVVLVAVFAVAFLGERPAAREWLGIGLVALGVLTLSFRR